MKKIITLFISLLFLTISSKANDRDIQLNRLFNELKINNAALVYGTEQKIWKIWSTHPTDEKLTLKLSKGTNLMQGNTLSKAIEIFSDLIELDPNWAEAWNKRANALYLIGDYEGSQKDINKVLELENRHFGALAGQGLVNIKLENYEIAIESYERAQEIYPAMQSPKVMIEQIKELIKQQLI
ncbi:tetratricopeptide repeat protein [Candidatus Pelagibacter sp. HIMB1321]|uniref:tetratricopeptide repeat protein n=1 Tax=Candidatus Pelagibacter sp. HIMB1321 TaxID=1388755 RepID=UPI000A08127C|nr:tetratricopeptide repeat protein [Candidatus Pelagibacter sp. HIMB1321]SMF77733.1 Tetratricopeptide repeat-containing protein [Candidatus Pelagibacter sp. HIMB1321]